MEIQLTGTFTYAELLPEFKRHPLVEGKIFFALPGELLEHLQRVKGLREADTELWKLESALSAFCAWDIGLKNGLPIAFPLLNYSPQLVSPEAAKQCGWSSEQLAGINTTGNARADWAANVARGYLGWLLTNPTFLREHDAILQEWHAEVADVGLPQMGAVLGNPQQMPGVENQPDGRIERFILAFEAFYVRWRLIGLAVPGLPQPLGPQLPVSNLSALLGHMSHAGQTFYFPDTYPVPTRDELRGVIEDGLRGAGAPEHLAEWTVLVRSGQTAKNAVSRYARLFDLQHYYHVLFLRHVGSLWKRKAHVVQAFSAFFKVSEDSIEKDLRFIAERLGEEWYLSPLAVPPKKT